MERVLTLPPVASRCDTCSNEDGSDGSLLRCTVCKDRFYCVSSDPARSFSRSVMCVTPQSAACQAQDWKEHKYSCSALPPDGLEYLKIESDQCREKVIQDYAALLTTWAEVNSELKKTTTGSGQMRFASSSAMPSAALKSRLFGPARRATQVSYINHADRLCLSRGPEMQASSIGPCQVSVSIDPHARGANRPFTAHIAIVD